MILELNLLKSIFQIGWRISSTSGHHQTIVIVLYWKTN